MVVFADLVLVGTLLDPPLPPYGRFTTFDGSQNFSTSVYTLCLPCQPCSNYFLQEIRKEELHLKDSEALIPVAHFHKVSDLHTRG